MLPLWASCRQVMIRVVNIKVEREQWLQTLEHMLQDNIYMKNKLAEIIKEDISAASLERAEYFHNELLNKDAIVALLRYDIIHQSRISVTDVNENAVSQKHEKLRSDMQMMEAEFGRLLNEFNIEFKV